MFYSSHRYTITSKKVLTNVEQANLRSICNRFRQFDINGRNALIFEIALDQGPRAREILNLEVRDFDTTEGTLFYRALKGSKDRELPLKPNVARRLKSFVLSQYSAKNWNELDLDSRIFQISYHRLWQIWCEYTPNPEKTFHSLRHTFAVNLYLKTRDIRLVQMALGHRQIQNTMVYMDFCYTQNTLKRIITDEQQQPRSDRILGQQIDFKRSLQLQQF
jgi:integrase/recombinase XerC